MRWKCSPDTRVVLAAYAASGAVLAVLLVFVAIFGQSIEPFLRPIVQFGYVDKRTGVAVPALSDFYRDKERACFKVHIQKNNFALIRKYVFEAEPELGTFVAVTVRLVDDDLKPSASQDLMTHPVGEQWARHYCFAIAGRIPDDQDIKITGYAEHSWQPFWLSLTPTPEFMICALGHRQDGACHAPPP